MTMHELVDPFEERKIPQGEREQLGTDTGIRIPLSLGTVREDYDKKGEAAQVYDVIWNPKTIERCKTDASFRQVVVELAFNHIAQRSNHILDLRFSIPKMKYKGKTIQFQRIRAKKGPKIQQMNEVNDQERKEMEAKSFDHAKRKIQEVVEATPDWHLYCVVSESITDKFDTAEFWDKLVQEMIKRSEETGVGDAKDRLDTLAETFRLPTSEGDVEEFDGVNHEQARRLVFVVSLPVIMRGHAIQVKVSEDLLIIRVPTLYKLSLGLPSSVVGGQAFFDCKLRKLFVVLPVKRHEEEAPTAQEKTVVVEVVDTKKLENDMLFDLV